MSFRVIVNTPDKTWYDGLVESLTGPGLDGRFGVRSRHAPMVVAIDTGILELRAAQGQTLLVVDAGVAEVTGDQVALTVDEVWPVRDAAEAEEKLQNLKQARQGQAREV